MRRITIAATAIITAVLSSPTTSTSSVPPGQLTFEDRVRAQEAIERVVYSHQVGASRTFEEALPQGLLEQKVRTYLKQSVALERLWQRPISAGDLSAELERMVRDTRDPGRLAELFEALGNDPFLIQECLARALLADRLARGHYASEAARHDPARLEADILHEQLATGQISLVEDEPHRSSVEVPPDAVGERLASTPPGSVGDVIEEPDGFTMSAVMEQDATRAIVASWFIPKVSWDSWWASVDPTLDATSVQPVASASVTVPALAGTGAIALPCGIDNVWTALSSSGAPSLRIGHSAVWTGSHMIIWGGGSLAPLSSGHRYDPATDSWSPTSMDNAPEGRIYAHAVWTGRVMIIWGGTLQYQTGLATGGRYDPVTDRWVSVSTIGAPTGRLYDDNVGWTGSEMIIWGGRVGDTFTLNTGGRYDPVTDTWTPMAVSGAPSARQGNTMVWTGSRLLVWGGACYTAANGCSNNFYNTGSLYDPVTDSWQPMTTLGAPVQRTGHSSVWTGSVMAIWGGSGPFDWSGTGQYDPAANTWLAHGATAGEPPPTNFAPAVWTGSRMVVWGGQSNGLQNYSNRGGRYDPATRTWTPTSMINSPTARVSHTMVWTGREVLLWGGYSGGTIRSDAGWAYSVDFSRDEDGDGFKASCECDDNNPAIRPGAAELCDGVDNDCDSGIDEDDPGGGQECTLGGSGACQTGLTRCSNGSLICVAFGPTETCDGLDNDCDGSVDERLGPGTLTVRLDSERLWPPNHRMVDIHATVSLTGGCPTACPAPPTVVLVSLTSSEPDDVNGAEDGQTANDIQDVTLDSADFDLKVRAERDGTGNGRFYELVYAATDCFGDTAVGTGGIFVPHDEGGQTEPVVLEVLPLQGGGTGSYALQWTSVAGADTYNVIRGRLSRIRTVGSFTVIEDSQCLASSLTGTYVSEGTLGEDPPPGEAFFYLTEYVKGSHSGYGTESSGRELIIASGDSCN